MAKESILIQLYFPVIGETYELWIPRKIQLKQVGKIIASLLEENEGISYYSKEQALICDRETGKILNGNATVEELHLMNGERLMLI